MFLSTLLCGGARHRCAKKSIVGLCLGLLPAALLQSADLRISSINRNGELTVSGSFSNGVVTVDQSPSLGVLPVPRKSVFSTATLAAVQLELTNTVAFF